MLAVGMMVGGRVMGMLLGLLNNAAILWSRGLAGGFVLLGGWGGGGGWGETPVLLCVFGLYSAAVTALVSSCLSSFLTSFALW